MATMKKKIPTQLMVGLGILLVGGGIIGGEYFPREMVSETQSRREKAKRWLPPPTRTMIWELRCRWRRALTEKVEPFAGGVRIYSPGFWSIGPSITITSQPNPDQSAEFTPQDLAKWETDGALHNLPRYHFEHTRINDRDAVLIWQYKNRAMLLTGANHFAGTSGGGELHARQR